MGALYILSFLYCATGVFYLVVAVHRIIRQNGIRVFDFSRLMYSIIFGFMPMLLYLKEAHGERNLFYTSYGTEEIINIYCLFLLSIVVYAVLNISYKSTRVKNPIQEIRSTLTNENDQIKKGKLLYLAGTIALAVGWISLILWTRAYGSITNFVLNANAIRSGRGTIHNSFAFMKQFVRVMSVALFAVYSAYLYIRPRGLKRVTHIFIIIFALIGNYYYTMASDSRSSIIYVGLALVAITLRHRKTGSIGKYIIASALIVFVFLLLTVYADIFTRYLRFGVWTNSNNGVFDAITKEFRFTLSSEMKAIQALFNGDLKIKCIDDFLNSITSWLPERFIPFHLPDTIWTYNTNLYGAMSSGTSPSDIVATSFYELGIIGIFVHPFLWGKIVANFDKRLWRFEGAAYTDVYYGIFVYVFVMQISHNQYSSMVLALFPAFVFFLITKVIDMIKHRRTANNEQKTKTTL